MPQGEQKGQNQSLDFYLVILFVFAVVFALWHFQHKYIVLAVYKFRFYEGTFALWLMQASERVVELFGYKIPDITELKELLEYMKNIDPATVTWDEFAKTSTVFGGFFVYPAIVIAVMLSIYMGFFHAVARFLTTFTMGLLSESQQDLWSQYTPIMGQNLVDTDINKGPWAMALRPLDFAEKYNIIFPEKTSDGKTIARLKKGDAHQVFSMQMGPLWTGLENLPPYALALFAAFCAKAENDDAGARKLLNQISRSSHSGKLDFGGTRELLVTHVKSKKVGRAVGPHAYLLTVMAEMLELARTDGVLANADFLWLKLVDRRLWLMLSSVGRQTPFAEVAGPFAHWKIEKRLRRKLKTPMVNEAVIALDAALSQIIYNPEDRK